MEIVDCIEKLKSKIKYAYNETKKTLGDNIYRGHSRAISSDIEDGIALFISRLQPSCKIFLDPSIHIDHKIHRPDLLVINNKNEVIAMVEIKANMGWCRNASGVIQKILSEDLIFKNKRTINCEFSNNRSYDTSYSNNVKLFLISLTKGNCSDKNHKSNKEYSNANNVYQFNLFDGWYDSLINCEIEEFAKQITNLAV